MGVWWPNTPHSSQSSCDASIVYHARTRLGKERDELGVIADQVGTPTNAADLADVCLKICGQLDDWSITNQVYHFSNEGVCSWYDFACAIMELNKIQCNINPIETTDYITKAKRPQYSVLNKSKIKKQFSIEGINWRQSLADQISNSMH